MTDETSLSLSEAKSLLAPLYNPSRRWDYAEECQLLLLLRVPDWRQEVETVIAYWKSIPPPQRGMMFPRSMGRLLADWTGVLDLAAVAKRLAEAPKEATASQKILWSQELKRIEKRQKTIRDSYDQNTSWSAEDRAEFAKLKARRNELMQLLGFVV